MCFELICSIALIGPRYCNIEVIDVINDYSFSSVNNLFFILIDIGISLKLCPSWEVYQEEIEIFYSRTIFVQSWFYSSFVTHTFDSILYRDFPFPYQSIFSGKFSLNKNFMGIFHVFGLLRSKNLLGFGYRSLRIEIKGKILLFFIHPGDHVLLLDVCHRHAYIFALS